MHGKLHGGVRRIWLFGREVLGLFPMVRVGEELEEAFPGGDADHQPVERHENADFGEMARAASDTGDGGRVGEDEIADEEAEGAHDEDGRGEEGVDAAGAEYKPDQRHQPIERIDELAEERAADEQMELQAVPEAEPFVEADKVASMNEIGLNVTFHPTGALFDPEKEVRAGLFPCGGFENACPPAACEEAQAEIAVFRHIVFIPSADFAQDIQAEVVGCAAERNPPFF